MRAPLVCSWLVITGSSGAFACRLEPVDVSGASERGRDAPGRPPPASPAPGQEPPPDGPPPASDGDSIRADAVIVDAAVLGVDSDGRQADAAGTRPDVSPPDRAPDAAPDAPPPLPQMGLVAHWPFDEGTGTSAADVTGNGATARLFNGAAWERSRVPGGAGDFAVRLDGVNDYLSAAVGNRFPLIEGAKTIAFWLTVDPDAPPSSGITGMRTCVALANPDMLVGIQMGIDRNRPAAWFWAQNQGLVIAPASPPAGAHHLAYTFDRTNHRLYLDGVQVDVSNAPPPQTGRASILYVGTYTPPNELCAGQIDDLRIYDRPLDPSEIERLAAPSFSLHP